MYKCPNKECATKDQDRAAWFHREVQAVAIQSLDQDGTITHTRFEETGRNEWHIVKCTHCGARAEWVDARDRLSCFQLR